ncbi:MAG TPA: hypothetical protein VF399_03595 [bacterium]
MPRRKDENKKLGSRDEKKKQGCWEAEMRKKDMEVLWTEPEL